MRISSAGSSRESVGRRHVVRRQPRSNALLVSGLVITLLALAAWLNPASAAAACPTLRVLSGSNFEIDVSANLKVDGAADCIDWLAGGTGTPLRPGVISKDDKPTGPDDDSFGQGTAEDDADPDHRGRLDPAEQERPGDVRRLHRDGTRRQVPRAVLVARPEPARDDEHGLRAQPEVLRPVRDTDELRRQRQQRAGAGDSGPHCRRQAHHLRPRPGAASCRRSRSARGTGQSGVLRRSSAAARTRWRSAR